MCGLSWTPGVATQRATVGERFRERFGVGDVEERAAELTGVECGDEVVVDDQAAAGDVDQIAARLELRQQRAVDETSGRLGGRCVQAEQFGDRDQVLDPVDLLDVLGPVRAEERVGGDDPGHQRSGHPGQLLGDLAESEQAEGEFAEPGRDRDAAGVDLPGAGDQVAVWKLTVRRLDQQPCRVVDLEQLGAVAGCTEASGAGHVQSARVGHHDGSHASSFGAGRGLSPDGWARTC